MQDMELIFANCLLYNGSQSVVGRYGIDLEQFWLKQWQKSGYAGARWLAIAKAACIMLHCTCLRVLVARVDGILVRAELGRNMLFLRAREMTGDHLQPRRQQRRPPPSLPP